jgi:hypothetical protein
MPKNIFQKKKKNDFVKNILYKTNKALGLTDLSRVMLLLVSPSMGV